MLEEFSFIAKLPGLVYAKDIHSKYLGVSQDVADLVGWNSQQTYDGKTDYDLNCDAVNFADEFIKMDKIAIDSGTKIVVLSIQKYTQGWKVILVERIPLKNNSGEIIGLYNPTIDVTHNGLFRSYIYLHQLDNKIANNNFSPATYMIDGSYCPLPLTEKQQKCLFLLIRGKSQKEIAKILRISPRTVENHLDAIKNKLNCSYKSEVIEKAIDSGFLCYIPKSLQDAEFNKIVSVI